MFRKKIINVLGSISIKITCLLFVWLICNLLRGTLSLQCPILTVDLFLINRDSSRTMFPNSSRAIRRYGMWRHTKTWNCVVGKRLHFICWMCKMMDRFYEFMILWGIRASLFFVVIWWLSERLLFSLMGLLAILLMLIKANRWFVLIIPDRSKVIWIIPSWNNSKMACCSLRNTRVMLNSSILPKLLFSPILHLIGTRCPWIDGWCINWPTTAWLWNEITTETLWISIICIYLNIKHIYSNKFIIKQGMLLLFIYVLSVLSSLEIFWNNLNKLIIYYKLWCDISHYVESVVSVPYRMLSVCWTESLCCPDNRRCLHQPSFLRTL